MTDDLTPAEASVLAAVEFLLEQMPEWARAECEALAKLHPERAGVAMDEADDDGLVKVWWMGRMIGHLRMPDVGGPPPDVHGPVASFTSFYDDTAGDCRPGGVA